MKKFISCIVARYEHSSSLKMWWLPFADILQNRSSYKFGDIHSKTPVLESLFSKVARPATLLKRGSDTGVFL